MSLAWAAYRAIAPLLGALAPAARAFASPHERPLWRERMGETELPGGCDAWVHGASLGEANAVLPLVRELSALQPGARFCLTATTRAGRARLTGHAEVAVLAPIDAPQAVRRFLAGVKPARLFIVETELWPHWLLHARAARIPVAIVSARLSERSVGRYRGLGGELRSLVAGLDGVLCQGQDDAGRWAALGARPERTEVVGNLKNDALPQPAVSRAEARHRLGLDPARPTLVLGSVRPGELRRLAAAWAGVDPARREGWQVAVVPRHPRAAGELREEAAVARQPIDTREAPRPGAWRWETRLGVLNDYYQAADVAFVGGSLLPYGGHNPLEPAACGAAVVVGMHHESQRDAVRALEAAHAVRVVADVAALTAAFDVLIGDAAERERQCRAAHGVIEHVRGASKRAVARLAAWNLWPVR